MAVSLRTKFILPLMLAGAVFMLLGASAIYWAVEDHLRHQAVERSRLLAVAINETVEVMNGYEAISFTIEDIVASDEGVAGISVITTHPPVVRASSFHPRVTDEQSSPRTLALLNEAVEQGVFGHYLLPGGDILTLYPLLAPGERSVNYRDMFRDSGVASAGLQWGSVLAQSRLSPEQYRGAIYLRLDSSAIKTWSTDIFLRTAGVLMLALTVLAALVYWVLHRIVLSPLASVSHTVTRQLSGDSSDRVKVDSDDEVGQLAASFNCLLDSLEERDRRIRAIVDNLPAALSLRSAAGEYQLMNNKFNHWMTALVAKGRGPAAEELVQRAEHEKRVWASAADVTFEERFSLPDGSTREFMTTAFPVTDAAGVMTAVGSVSTDITERKAIEREVRDLAYFDTLTSLPNRRLFRDRLVQALKNAERNGTLVGLIYLDLDGFKSVNDTLGHQAGDQLLQETCVRLIKSVRTQDTVARLGGDEFTVIVVDLDPTRAAIDLAAIATKIRASIARPVMVAEQQTFVTSSMGITLYPDNALSADEMVMQADIAMYHAKRCGRDGFQFYRAEMNEALRERRRLEDQLRTALERDELSVVYQPKVDILTGELTGAEALLRWKNPVLGQVPPLRFIPVAEESGLIIPIGNWVIEEVIGHLKRWRSEGVRLPRVAINLSPRQLRDKSFAQNVERLLASAGVDPSLLEFEITEGVFLREVEHSHSSLYTLRESGVGLAIDDFGTGFSSLSYLKKLPVSCVKIDKGFIDGVTVDSVDEDIIAAIIAMAHSMHLSVVAEGVETKEQLAFLRSVNCDASQGWLTGEPMSMVAFGEWLKAQVPVSAEDTVAEVLLEVH